MDFHSALLKCKDILKLQQWKPAQIRCLRAVWDNSDLLAVLPTGYGKSAVFQAAPFLTACRDGTEAANRSVIVISPINAIMVDQCMKLCSKGISACYLDYKCDQGMAKVWSEEQQLPEEDDEAVESDEEADGDIMSAVQLEDVPSYQLIYAHPETLISRKAKPLISALKKQTCAIAVDEAHIILEW